MIQTAQPQRFTGAPASGTIPVRIDYPPKGLVGQLLRVALAAGIMGLVVWGTLRLAHPALDGFGDGVWIRAVRALGGVALGAVVYAAACRALRIGEMDEILSGAQTWQAHVGAQSLLASAATPGLPEVGIRWTNQPRALGKRLRSSARCS